MTSLRTCNTRARRAARRAAGRPAPRTTLAIAIRRRLNGPLPIGLPAGAILTSSGCGPDPDIGEARRREIDDAIRARAPSIAFEHD